MSFPQRNLDLIARLRTTRVRAGITQSEMASDLGITQPSVSKIEMGERAITALESAIWADRCGVTLDALIRGEGQLDDSEKETVE